MDDVRVKPELIEYSGLEDLDKKLGISTPIPVIDLSSSDSDSDDYDSSSDDDGAAGIGDKSSRDSSGGLGKKRRRKKRRKTDGVILPLGFLDPLPSKQAVPQQQMALQALVPVPVVDENVNANRDSMPNVQGTKQFWKAGDFEGTPSGVWDNLTGGMDHVRVHPKFLHSNATSHKWVLGAFAELLDNSLDEVCNGATYVNIDMLKNKKDGSKMLLVEDNGGGMDPEKMRQCMSLGYSAKSKIANTIGQYGNGFKTSTMRLGADVIVFSRSRGKDGRRSTQSIGLLSYTFLRSTGKEDIVVPMLDYERGGQEWNKVIRATPSDWNRNVETIVEWSPFSNEADLLQQFNQMKDQGTLIIIYNLWEDDQGQLELDFGADQHDIQIRGVNRDEKNIQMAKKYPNSRHFLTYRHSLRSYASILYLRIPHHFRIILRGKDVVHHNVVNDMMFTQETTYRPQPGGDAVPKDLNMVAVVTIGFVKDAKDHIDVQGFNVYHKNRLIKPFWRLWNASGSDGRGVIGVLEANFVEPAHDKQGFERTTVLSRLETRLIQMQKTYWSTNCHKIGYAPRVNKKQIEREASLDYIAHASAQPKSKYNGSSSKPSPFSDKFNLGSKEKQQNRDPGRYSTTPEKIHGNGKLHSSGKNYVVPNSAEFGKVLRSSEPSSPSVEDVSDSNMQTAPPKGQEKVTPQTVTPQTASPPSAIKRSFEKDGFRTTGSSLPMRNAEAERDCASNENFVHAVNGITSSPSSSNSHAIYLLKEENHMLKEKLKRKEAEVFGDLQRDLQYEKDKCQSIENQLHEATQKIDELNKEQESLIDIFSEERERRDIEEENLRKKLKDASNTIQDLLDKVRLLEKTKAFNSNIERCKV